MLAFLNEKFKGKKTYTTAIVAILTALITYLNGEATVMQALELAFTGALGITLRNGIANALVAVLSSEKK